MICTLLFGLTEIRLREISLSGQRALSWHVSHKSDRRLWISDVVQLMETTTRYPSKKQRNFISKWLFLFPIRRFESFVLRRKRSGWPMGSNRPNMSQLKRRANGEHCTTGVSNVKEEHPSLPGGLRLGI
jgi:hypothetical protein